MPEDENGTIPEVLESILEERLSKGLKLPKLMYLVPTGSNPTGAIISNERRQMIYDLACKYNIFIIEDDPYMFMNYSDVSVKSNISWILWQRHVLLKIQLLQEQVVSFLSLDTEGRVLRLDSLSKVLSSGLRAGWVTAPRPFLQRLELHMQASHLHSATLSQVRWKTDHF